MTDYNYHNLNNLDINIRISTNQVIYDNNGNVVMKIPMLNNAQVKLTDSDMEDILENANAVANSVTLYYNQNSNTQTLQNDEINPYRDIIANALSTLLDNLTNVDFISKYIETLVLDNSEDSVPIDRFKYSEINNDYEVIASLQYKPYDILSNEPIFMKAPGAIINNFTTLNY